VGALDGKHVMIEKPPNSQSLYINYKKHFSIVLMAIAGPDYKFTAIDVGHVGSSCDGGIFQHCKLGHKVIDSEFHFPPARTIPKYAKKKSFPHVIVADEAFPLRKNLMRPYPGRSSGRQPHDEWYHNKRLSRARRIVENAFGKHKY
jgi:hypothetical protein